MNGTTVTVLRDVENGTDEFGSPVATVMTEQVDNVLIAPVSDKDLSGSIRPDGIEVALVLHFPKTYTTSLRGTRIKLDGQTYAVIGDPVGYMPENTPGPWNRPVQVERIEG